MISATIPSSLWFIISYIYDCVLDEAWQGTFRTVFGFALGLLFIFITEKVLNAHESITVLDMDRADAKKVILIIFVMTIHSLTEGVGIGVSFGGDSGMKLGKFIALSLAAHNVPEGLAVALVLKSKHVSNLRTGSCSWKLTH
jgi:ZIP family zinc transporter